MKVPSLVRKPLAWLVAAEIVAAAGCGALAFHLWRSGQAPRPPLVQPSAASPPGRDLAAELAPGAPSPSASPSRAPGPGRPEFLEPALAGRLSGIDREQAELLRSQWRVIQALTAAARSYLEGVVLPAVERAQRSAAGAQPAEAAALRISSERVG